MRRSLFAALLFCSAALSAQALQLGETKAQLLARHGAPGAEDQGKKLAIYYWGDWSAQLEFQDEVVRKLVYRRNWYLGDSEMASLLQSNGGATHWREVTTGGGKTRQWQRDDGAVASCLADRALSMTFQSAPPAGTLAAAPKVVVPAAAPIVSSTPPTFPRLLGSTPEPELPQADESLPEPAPTPAPRALPKLAAEEIQPATVITPENHSTESISNSTPRELENVPAVIPPESPAVQSGESDNNHSGYAGIVGVLLALGALAGGALYLRKRRSPRFTSSTVSGRSSSVASESNDLPNAAGSRFAALRWDQFELLVGEIFRREGYTIELSAALGSDDGIDLTLRRDSETILVQCKHWKTARVTERELREFYGAMAASGAPRGIFVTTGGFTREAREFAESQGIELMDGAALEESVAEVARPGENIFEVAGWIEEFTAQARIYDPECPVCHGTMVVRANRANGAQAWGCRGYPRCPGKRAARLDLLAATAGR